MFRTAWVTFVLLLTATASDAQNQTGQGLLSTTWTGAVDSDWDDPSNWTQGVPSSGVNAVVPATANDPSTLDTVGAACAHLTIEAGASLDVPPTDRLLVFAGASIAGPVSGQGLVRFVGPGQLVSPSPAPVVTPLVSIAADVSFGGALLRLTRVRLESGVLDVAAGNTTRVTGQARFEGGSLVGDGTLDLNGDSFFTGAEVLAPPTILASRNLAVDEDFDPLSGSVVMDGNGPRTITLAGAAATARFFDFAATAGATINTAVPFWIRGDFTLDGKLRTTGAFDLDGDLVGSGELDFQSASALVTFGGGIDFGGLFTSLGGIVFDGAGDDSLALGAATTLPDTEIAVGGTLTAVSPAVVVAGDLLLSSGQFVISEFTTLTVQGATTFAGGTLGGEGILDLEAGDLNVDSSSTVTFAGVDLTINGDLNLTQGQLEIIDGSVTRVEGNANFAGGSLLGNGGRLEVIGDGLEGGSAGNVRFVGSISSIPPEILLTGDWTADENFAPAQGRVIFDGASQVIQRETEGGGPLQFHRVEVNSGSAVYTGEDLALGDALFVDGDGKSDGSFETDGDMTVEGDFTIDGSFTSTTGNLDVDGDVGGDGDINFISVTGDTTFGGDLDFGGSMSSAGMISFNGLGEHFIQTNASTVLPPTDFEGDGTITVVGGLVQIGAPTAQAGGGGDPASLYMRHLSGNLRIETGTTLRILGSARFAAPGGELQGAGGTLDVDGDVVFAGTQVDTPPDFLVAGDWTADSAVLPTSGRVRFDGGAQEILGAAAQEGGGDELRFFRVEIAPSSSTSTAEHLALGEDLDVQSDETGDGSFDTDGDLSVGGDFNVDGSFLSTTGNLDVDGDVTGDGDVNLASVTGDTNFGGDMDFGGSMSSAGMISFNGLGEHFVQTNASTVLPPTDFEGEGTITVVGGLVQIGAPAAAPGGGGVAPDFFLRHLAGHLEVEAGTTLRVLGSARFEATGGELFGAGGTIDVEGDVLFDGTQVATPPDFLVAGDWTANSAVLPSSGRVRFDGGAQEILGVATQEGGGDELHFFRVEVAPSSSTSTAEHLALGEDLDVQSDETGDGSFDTDGDLSVGGDFNVDGSFLSTTGNLDVDGDVTGDGDINLASVTGETNFGGDLDFGGSVSSAGMISFNGLGEHFVQTSAATVLPPTDFAGTGRMLIKGGVVQIGSPAGPEGEASAPIARHLSGILEIEAGSTLHVLGSARLEAAGGELIGGGGTGALAVDGDLEFAGTASTNPPDIDVTGRWTADEQFQPEAGAVVLRGAESTLTSTAPGQELFFHDLLLAEGRRTPTSDVALHLSNLHITGGELDTAQHTVAIPAGLVEVEGRLVVASGGRLELGSDATVSIQPAGTFSARGDYPELAVVAGHGGGGYDFQVDGALEAVNFVFEDMGPGGIVIGNGAGLGAAPADLRGGTFRSPSAVLGSVMLDVSRPTPTDFRYLSFEDPLGVGTFNVRTPLASAPVSFTNFGGNLAGEDFDSDPGEEDDNVVWNEPDVTELVFFAASPGPEVVTLDWATTKEVDTAGFVLERAGTDETSPASFLTELVPSGPASYQFADLTAPPLVVQEYRLLARLSHGPLELLGADIAMAYTSSLPPNATIVNPELQGLFAIELAVQAVTQPDSLLIVQPGTYRPFTVTSETPSGLRILGDPNGEVLIDTTFEPVLITGVPAGHSVEISGLVIGTGFAGLDPTAEGAMASPGVLLTDNEGTIVLDRLEISPASGQAGVAVHASTAAVVQDSQVAGTPGLRAAAASRVVLSAGELSTFEVIEGSELFSAGVSVPGGSVDLDSSVTTFDGVHPNLQVPDLVVLNNPVDLELTAAPDTPWIGLLSPGLALVDLMSPAFQMFLLADPGTLFLLTPDVTDGAGQGSGSVELPADPVFLGLKLVFQVITIDAGTGAFRFSNVRSAVPLQ